ncbi:MAG: hypothetical protein M9894_25345 [Planctomycetes bacterium]|nr:hypothetical protein [Planctomycetota bacterium]
MGAASLLALAGAVAPLHVEPEAPAEVVRRRALTGRDPEAWRALARTLRDGYQGDGWRGWSMRQVAPARAGSIGCRPGWRPGRDASRWLEREQAWALHQAAALGCEASRAAFWRLAERSHQVAFEWPARAGDPEAGLRWARLLRQGTTHVYEHPPRREPDVAEARRWYRRLAAAGHAEAARELGDWLLRLPPEQRAATDLLEGVAWLREAARVGDAVAARRLADLEADGARLLRLAARWAAAPPDDFEPAWLETGELLLALGEPLAAEACLGLERDPAVARRVRVGLVLTAIARGATVEASTRLDGLAPGDLPPDDAARLRARLRGQGDVLLLLARGGGP